MGMTRCPTVPSVVPVRWQCDRVVSHWVDVWLSVAGPVSVSDPRSVAVEGVIAVVEVTACLDGASTEMSTSTILSRLVMSL